MIYVYIYIYIYIDAAVSKTETGKRKARRDFSSSVYRLLIVQTEVIRLQTD